MAYGGNTMCVEVRSASGAVVVLDAGTGVRELGKALAAERVREVDLLLTHLHLDHIEGLGFLAPLFDAECRVRILGPHQEGATLAERIVAYLSPPYFPLPFAQFGAAIEFVELGAETFCVGGIEVAAAFVRHPGPTLGYRLTENGRSLAFIPDNEPGLDPESGLVLARGADVLLHDAQYTDEEYAERVGWGHTAVAHLVRYLAEAAPGRAVLVHHDPDHDAAALERLRDDAAGRAGRELELGFEGLELTL